MDAKTFLQNEYDNADNFNSRQLLEGLNAIEQHLLTEIMDKFSTEISNDKNELLNAGYRTAILDAIDLVEKLTIPVVCVALDTEFLQALNDLIDRKLGNEPTKERF